MSEKYQKVKLYYINKIDGISYFEVRDESKKLIYKIEFTKEKANFIESEQYDALMYIDFANQSVDTPIDAQQSFHLNIREKSDMRQYSFTNKDPFTLEVKEYLDYSNGATYQCGRYKGVWKINVDDDKNTTVSILRKGAFETKFGTLNLPIRFDEFKRKVFIFAFAYAVHCVKSFEKVARSSTRSNEVMASNAYFYGGLSAYPLGVGGYDSYCNGTFCHNPNSFGYDFSGTTFDSSSGGDFSGGGFDGGFSGGGFDGGFSGGGDGGGCGGFS